MGETEKIPVDISIHHEQRGTGKEERSGNRGTAGTGRQGEGERARSLVLAALFLLGTINNRAGFRDGACEVALGVHVTDLLRGTNDFASNEK